MTTRAVPNRAMKEALRFLYPALMRLAAVFAKDRNGQKKKKRLKKSEKILILIAWEL